MPSMLRWRQGRAYAFWLYALAVALKRRQSEQGGVATPESEASEIVGEYVTAPEPIPAT